MTQNDVRALIRCLEDDTLPRARWTHDAHLAMAVWYLTYLPRRQALRVIRHRIASYNEARAAHPGERPHYHETITTFLAKGVAAFLDALPEKLVLDQRLERARAAFANFRPLLTEFYASQTLASAAARARWVEPDRRPMHAWLRACEKVVASPAAATAPTAATACG